MAQNKSHLINAQDIHPALWRASQLAGGHSQTINTGWPDLNQQLPGQGWPCGALTELCLAQHGIGELRLLRPALAQCPSQQQIVLINCPFMPHAQCWANWSLAGNHPLLWVKTSTLQNTLWAAEQTLRHNACAALLCWLPACSPRHLHRLNVAAQGSEALCFFFSSLQSLRQPSPVPLRIALKPDPQGLGLHIAKRQGPSCNRPVVLALNDFPRVLMPRIPYVKVASHALDQPVFH